MHKKSLQVTTPESLIQLIKDNKFDVQFNEVYKEFLKEPQTMKQVSVKLDIDRANICWYCQKLRKLNQIESYNKTICPVTKHRATLWTTNSDLFPSRNQLKLF